MKATYKGSMRTTLSREERKALKANALKEGMTLTGYVDALCRRAIKEGENGTQDTRAQLNQRLD